MDNGTRSINLRTKALSAGLIGLAALAAEGLLTPPEAPAAPGNPKGWDIKTSKKVYDAPAVYGGTTGVYVAAGDVDGDGVADMITGNGPGVDNTFNYMKF